jgi:hypothetical protein
VLLLLGGTALAVTVLVISIRWHDNRPSPVGLWLTLKGLGWTATALKIAVAAGVGAARVGKLRSARKRRRDNARIPAPDPAATAPATDTAR